MFEDALVELVKKASPWVVNLFLLSIAAVILIWVFSALRVLKKDISVHSTADKLIELQGKYHELSSANSTLQQKHSQTRIVLDGLKSAYTEARYLFYLLSKDYDIREQAEELLRSILEKLAAELKFDAGESHRCAIWTTLDSTTLISSIASSGFSDYYRRRRELGIDKSIAGRCYRTKGTIYLPNIQDDRDFRHRPGLTHKYKSLICVPLVFGDDCLGVVTVDGKEENSFFQEDIEIVQAYSEIIAMVIMMYIANTQAITREEAAISGEKHNNG